MILHFKNLKYIWNPPLCIFTDYAKAFDCVDHYKLRRILKELGIPDHLPCLMQNLYAGQKATVRIGHGMTHWEKSASRLYIIITPFIQLIYKVHHVKHQTGWITAGIKISGRNINNLTYADNTTLMVESKKELKSFFMKVKEDSERESTVFPSRNE